MEYNRIPSGNYRELRLLTRRWALNWRSSMKTQRVKRYVTSDRVIMKGPTEEMIFEQRLEESQDAKHVIIWETSIL